MVHGSLFSGIGGFDLAAEWMGWENAFHCEINPFCQKVLKHYWPYAKSYSDIKRTDFSEWRGRIDVLSGGFPCQPYSVAGKQLGSADDRHLWPQNLRAIDEIKPGWIVGENVRGLISWNDGLVFEQICVDLENAGYNVQPFILPAAGVGADHRRERVWIVAHTNRKRRAEFNTPTFSTQKKKGDVWNDTKRLVDIRTTSWNGTVSTLLREANGFSEGLSAFERNSAIAALGNAIVPQVVYRIFQTIDTYEMLY